jgi:protein involved in plasmid replication-relaxation
MPSKSSRPHSPARLINPLSIHPHLTARDRDILELLDQHRVMTSDQLHRIHFQALRTCLLRLNALRSLALLDRFRFARPYGGTEPWKWVLGLNGARFVAAAHARPSPTERAHRDHVMRISASPTLTHLLTTNEFFASLHHSARNTSPPGADHRLDRWWSERETTNRFLGIQPDGHGLWTNTRTATTTGFFLECDLGTETLTRLTAKLLGYARSAAGGGPRYPVLFWLPSLQRETHLQNLLRQSPPPVPVATAVHGSDPANPVWLPADGWQRLRLDELPSDHGPESAHNPTWRDGQLDLSAR